MSGLDKSLKSAGRKIGHEAKRAGKKIEENFQNPGDSTQNLMQDTGMAPKIPTPEEPTIIGAPNDQALALAAKKKRAGRTGVGRSSTILTEGLGG